MKQLESVATVTEVQYHHTTMDVEYQHATIDMINTQTIENAYAFEQTSRGIDLPIVDSSFHFSRYFVAIILSKNLSCTQRNVFDTLVQEDLFAVQQSLNATLENLCPARWNFNLYVAHENLNVVQKHIFIPVGSSHAMQKNLGDTETNHVDTKSGLCDGEASLPLLQRSLYASKNGVHVVRNDENVVQHDIFMASRSIIEQMNAVKVTQTSVANEYEQHSVSDNIREAQIPVKILRPAAHSAGSFGNSFETVADMAATMSEKRGVTSAAARAVARERARGSMGTNATARTAVRGALRGPTGSVSCGAHGRQIAACSWNTSSHSLMRFLILSSFLSPLLLSGCVGIGLLRARENSMGGSIPIHPTSEKGSPEKPTSPEEKMMLPEKTVRPRAFLDKASSRQLEKSSPDAAAIKSNTRPEVNYSIGRRGEAKASSDEDTTAPGSTGETLNKGTISPGTTDNSTTNRGTTNPGTIDSSSKSVPDSPKESTTTDNSMKSTTTASSSSSFSEGVSDSCSSTSSAASVKPLKEKENTDEEMSIFVPSKSDSTEPEGERPPDGPVGTKQKADDKTPISNLHAMPAAAAGMGLGSKIIGTSVGLGVLGGAAYVLRDGANARCHQSESEPEPEEEPASEPTSESAS